MVLPHLNSGAPHQAGRFLRLLLPFLLLLLFTACAKQPTTTQLEVTAYCGCSSCCDWERGSWAYLKLDFWNKYVSKGPRQGASYSGRTASGTYPREPQQGFFSVDSLQRPWMIPIRVVLPWKFLPSDGTIAADTAYYPFGTRMYVPGYGWGRVEDRGGAIKGPTRIDIFYHSHQEALQWGRRRVNVTIERQ